MEYITKETLIKALKQAGINKGDTLLVHSNIASFGPIGDMAKNELLNIYYSSFMEILGKGGTICVPAFFFEYTKGIPYRYNKLFNIPILDNGKVIFENSVCYVRYLDYNIVYKGQKEKDISQYEWLHQPFIKKVDYLNSFIRIAYVQSQIDFIKEKLYINPYYRLKYPPSFVENEIPLK